MNDVPTRLLRETLQARVPAASSTACLDAETVAAWADDALPRGEREAAEAHAADCARCQTLLAAMATTAPPETAGRSWWRLPALTWLVPLTVATAAVLVWVNVPGSVVAPPTSMAEREARVVSPQAPASAGAAPNAQPPAAVLRQAAPPATVAPKPAVEARRDKERAAKLDALRESTADTVRDEASQPAPANAPSAADNRVAAAATKAEATAQLPAAAGAAPQRSAAESASPPPAPAPALQRSAAPPPIAMSARMFDVAPRLIASPNPAIVWRIATNGAVERSTDSGSTWQRQSTGVTVTLAAGAAPSASICWLVGPQGTVLLTTDGRSWRRIEFPEAVDLASVRASDDKSATVATADGRAFSTTDGGRTWKRS
jgi:hypothetical protein